MGVIKPIIEYRLATSTDTYLVAQITEETFRESWTEEGNQEDMDHYISENFTNQIVEKELANLQIAYLLAFDGNYPVGYLKLDFNLQPDTYQLEKPASISRVYVRKSQQGLQIGSSLLKQAIAKSLVENYKTIWLGVWNQNNGAMRLYQKFGFVQFGMYQFIMGSVVSDDFLMMRKL